MSNGFKKLYRNEKFIVNFQISDTSHIQDFMMKNNFSITVHYDSIPYSVFDKYIQSVVDDSNALFFTKNKLEIKRKESSGTQKFYIMKLPSLEEAKNYMYISKYLTDVDFYQYTENLTQKKFRKKFKKIY